MKIGACLSLTASNLKKTAQEAVAIGANTFMVYYGGPTSYNKPKINKLLINEGIEFMNRNSISAQDIVLHANYISNFASPEEEKRNMAMNMLAKEIEGAKEIGIKYIVIHPGSYTTGNPKTGIQNVADCINYVLEEDDNVVLCLETMAGKGKELGRDCEELQCIIEKIEMQDKIGVCLDTAHMWDAGYHWDEPEDLLDELDGIIGLEKVKVVHLNGSLNPCGSKKDRHANIFTGDLGENKIGSDNMWKIFHNPRLAHCLYILETPEQENGEFLFAEEIAWLKQTSI